MASLDRERQREQTTNTTVGLPATIATAIATAPITAAPSTALTGLGFIHLQATTFHLKIIELRHSRVR